MTTETTLHYLGALNRPGAVLCCVCGDFGSLTDFLVERVGVRR